MIRRVILSAHPHITARTECHGRQVVTPNRLAAVALQVPYLSLDQLAANQLRRGTQLADALARRQALRDVVAAKLVGASPRFARAWVEPALRHLLRAVNDWSALRGQAVPARLHQLATIADCYVAHLARRNTVDPAQAAWKCEVDVRRPLLVSGYARHGHSELRFIDAVAGNNSVVVLPVGDAACYQENKVSAAWLRQRGWQIECSGQTDGSTRVMSQQSWPSQHEEARSALAWAKDLMLAKDVQPHQIMLVARDERAYGPLLSALAARMELPLKLSYSVPLRDTRLGQWLAGAMSSLTEDLPYESTLRWLGASWRKDATQVVASAFAGMPSGAGWREVTAPVPHLSWPGETCPVATWATWLAGLVRESGALGLQEPREQMAALLIQRAITEAAAGAAGATWTVADVVELVEDWLDLLTVPAQPGRGGVGLHTPLALLGAQVEHVWVLGASEGVLPANVTTDSYLDFVAREQANDLLSAAGAEGRLETASEAATREDLVLEQLFAAATSTLRFSWPELRDGAATGASAWLRAHDLTDSDDRPPIADRPHWRQATLLAATPASDEDEVATTARRAYDIEWRRESADPADAYDGVLGQAVRGPRRWSATQLGQLANCPFSWFSSFVLGLGEPDECELEPDASVRGMVLHRALELLVRTALEHHLIDKPSALAALTAAALSAAVSEPCDNQQYGDLVRQIAELYPSRSGSEPDAARGAALRRFAHWPLVRAEWLAWLVAVVGRDDFIAGGELPVELETQFKGEWHCLPVRGIIDRVDKVTSGGVRLVDYKSGSSVQQARRAGETSFYDLQASIYQAGYHSDVGEVVGGRYLRRGTKAEPWRAPDQEKVPVDFAQWAMDSVEYGRLPVAPGAQALCRYCEFDALCRRGVRLERKGVSGDDTD